ncbi:hypothetical protein GCM10027277_43350 [Pseudoduganella ginsengisoli]
MKNSGSTTWTAGTEYKLGSQNPQDNSTWGGRILLTSSVAPGAQYAFHFPVTAPPAAGTYNFQWRMLREYVEWFGATTPNVAIVVSASPTAAVVTYFHNDAAGTPMLATNASGAVLWKETYQPYGERIVHSPASASNALWFAGRPYDENAGLSYMGARYYDPLLGRFVGVDPVEFEPKNVHGFNRYAYANNNPYKYVDPAGESPVDLAFLAFDLGKLGIALYTGVGISAAIVDVGLSTFGVFNPVPLTGQAMKAAIAAEKAVEVARIAGKETAVAKDFFAGSKYTDKVLGQIKQRDLHGFPESVKGFQEAGQQSKVRGGDGVVRDMLTIPGEYRGREGFFEFIKEADGTINHRLFRPLPGQ